MQKACYHMNNKKYKKLLIDVSISSAPAETFHFFYALLKPILNIDFLHNKPLP